MENQNDKNEITMNSQGQNNMSFINPISNKAINKDSFFLYDTLNKKTEKLVTALYMVTDCIEVNDALKNKLRYLSVELLSDMYTLSVKQDTAKSVHIDIILVRIKEIISCTDIACTIGFISEMNNTILKKEFTFLINELNKYQSKNSHFSFVLNADMFAVNDKESVVENPIPNKLIGQHFIKDKKEIILKDKNLPRNDRAFKIVSFIKDKKEVTVKDISTILKDYSEKTIQRELNTLVDKGQIKKIGSKRWSRYSSIS